MPAMKSLLTALASAALCWPLESFAADAGRSPDQLAEIVVTAQKRVEDIQRVPISVSVFDAASFDRLSIEDLADVATKTRGDDGYLYRRRSGTSACRHRRLGRRHASRGFRFGSRRGAARTAGNLVRIERG